MLSIGRMSGGQSRYYTNLASEDYYLDGGEPPGLWWGSGSEQLGLNGQVRKEQLSLVFDGFSPDGKALVQNAGSDKRRPGFDLTFSAPKSVSVAWSVAPEHIRHEIQAAQADAVKAALGFLEREAGFARTGKAGVDRHQAGLVVAMFEHGTSRALDPQLHTHALLLNLGVMENGRVRALVHTEFFNLKMIAGALYRAELASQLERRLGLISVPDIVKGFGFHLKGIQESVCDFFSKRRADMEELMGPGGLETAKASEVIAKQTRQIKDVVPARSELFSGWRNECEALGLIAEAVHQLCGQAPRREPRADLERCLDTTLENLGRNHSHFDRKQIFANLAEAAIAHGLDAKKIEQALATLMEDEKKLVRLGPDGAGVERFTTPAIRDREMKLVNDVADLAEEVGHGVDHKLVESLLARYDAPRSVAVAEVKQAVEGIWAAARRKPFEKLTHEEIKKQSAFTLSDEQSNAVRFLTSMGNGSIRVLEGDAGTGKTTALSVAREVWEKGGYKVIGTSLAGKAVEELRSGSDIRSFTFASLTGRLMAGHSLLTTKRNKYAVKLDGKSVVVVDEAGMFDTQQLARLASEVKLAGAKLILVGDRKQLQAIGPGGAFAYVADKIGKAELTTIIRQRDERDRAVVTALRSGDAATALKQLKERGLLTVSDSPKKAIQALAKDWADRESKDVTANSLIFVNTNQQAEELNRLCQSARQSAGVLGSKFLHIGKNAFHEQDRVLLRKTNATYGVNNGDLGTIVAMDNGVRNRSVTVRLDRGGAVKLPLEDYCLIDHGYAVTTHKGQGTTVDRAYILVGGQMQDREISYVQGSRAREGIQVYCTKMESEKDLARIEKAMSTSRQKSLSLAVTNPNDGPTPPRTASADQEEIKLKQAREAQEIERQTHRLRLKKEVG